ncbi:MAG: glycosyltransferase family 4 protein [Actinomycetes bacterium]
MKRRANGASDRGGDPGIARRGTRIVFCNWRDLTHPQGGGSELFLETVARGLAMSGHEVTLLTAAVPGQPRDEVRDGVRYRRRGGPFGVYLHAAFALLTRRVRADVVVDVQNGVPFLSPLVTRCPVVTLVHHVHREQWPVVYGPRLARIGWWVESRVAPLIYRRSRYIAVSESTRRELTELGIDATRIDVVHNGGPLPLPVTAGRLGPPHLLVLGRLVPHKRVEAVLRAAAALRTRVPGLTVDVVGEGYWHKRLAAEAAALRLEDTVRFHGWVDEGTKIALLARTWVNAVPSLKEGWGLSVIEAATFGAPSVGFRNAGGLSESIVDGVTGVLVDDETAFLAALERLLTEQSWRVSLGRAAQAHAATFSWEHTIDAMAEILTGEKTKSSTGTAAEAEAA